VLVDKVSYGDDYPWPVEADGTGDSLQRRQPNYYGNDPVNWKSLSPTAGRANVAGSDYTDADADGLPDSWEAANGLSSGNAADAAQDSDGDGRSNTEEYFDGTNPQSAVSKIEMPVFTAHPQTQDALPGGNVAMSVTASGTAPLHYQWRFDGLPLADETNATLNLTSVVGANSGLYDVVVWNTAGFAASQGARLTVLIPPNITQQPVQQVVNPGQTATFTVAANGTGPIRYQWQRNGVDLAGATASTLTINNAQLGNEGEYRVLVTDDITTIPSTGTRLIVRVAPIILVPPVGETNSVGANVTFSVMASGSVPMHFQWRKGSQPLTNIMLLTTNCSFTLYNIQTNDAAFYRVVITNSANASPGVPSGQVPLVVLTTPIITAQPQNTDVLPGGNANFSVTASGAGPLGYQWQFNGADLGGQTASSLSVNGVQSANEGYYKVRVTNASGFTDSQAALLTILVEPQLHEIEMLSNGAARMKLSGNTNRSYSVEVSSNLTNWTGLTNLFYTNGLMPFIDSTSLGGGTSNRFYRVRLGQ
jgi:hypothetical protein